MTSRYFPVAMTALRQTLAQRSSWLGRCALFGVIMTVFSHLWKTTFAKGAAFGMGPVDMIWYMAATEWIVLSVPSLHLAVEAEVRSGDVAYQLSRPVSFLGVELAKGFGATAAHFVPVGIVGFGLAWFLSGALPQHGPAMLFLLPLVVLAVTVLVVISTAIGLTSFWLQDAGPVFWVFQKLLFTLGGLILPLALYPEWLQGVAKWLPFAALLNGPASMMVTPGPAAFAGHLALLVGWGGVALLLTVWLHARGLRILDVNGG